MKRQTSRGRRPGSSPQRAHRGHSSSTGCDSGSIKQRQQRQRPARDAAAPPPASATTDGGHPPSSCTGAATSLAGATAGNDNAAHALGRSACAAVEAQQAAEDTDAKDGMRRPPSWRPHSITANTIARDAIAASAEEPRKADGQMPAASRLPHSLAPPPRRRARPVTTNTSLSSSSSSSSPLRRRYSRSVSSDSVSASSDGDEDDSREAGGRRAYQRVKHKNKGHRNPPTPRSRASAHGKQAETSSDEPALSSRRSRVSRSSQKRQKTHDATRRRQRAARKPQKQTKKRKSSVSPRSSSRGSEADNTNTTDSDTTQSPSVSASTSANTTESENEDEVDDDARSTSLTDSASENRLLSSSASSAAASPCALTDLLPRELYLHICSFLDEVDCCTLLEVSLRMHAAITNADSYVWRRLCMNTWRYKQGFQTFIQRIRALESLARREEREVQALQQHMLLLREQGTFFGESDVSATCDDATVLLRRRQHERAQWVAAAASWGPAAPHGSGRPLRRTTTVGSSATTSASSDKASSDDDSGEQTESGTDSETPSHRGRRRNGGRRRRACKRAAATTTTHRTNTASAATASSSRRSGEPISRVREKLHSPSLSSSQKTLSPPLHGGGHVSAQSAASDSVAGGEANAAVESCATDSGVTPRTPCAAAARKAGAELSGDDQEEGPGPYAHSGSEEERGRRQERRVRIRLPEDEREGSGLAESQEGIRDNTSSTPSGIASASGSPKKKTRQQQRHQRHRQPSPSSHSHNQESQHSDASRRQTQQQQQRHSTQQPPISRHRRSHSVKRKPAKQRRRNRGRSRRPRATGGGGGRHRSQHHRSQSRHHRSSRAHSNHHRHHHHNPKATKSTRRRRRRQRNAAAAAASAGNGDAGGSLFSASHNGTVNSGASGGGASGGGHGSTFFYQTATYEAIKSTTPVLSVQHVAPVIVPFQLGGRPNAPLPLGAASASPVVSSISRYPSRDSVASGSQQPNSTTPQPAGTPNAATAAPPAQPFALPAASSSLSTSRGTGLGPASRPQPLQQTSTASVPTAAATATSNAGAASSALPTVTPVPAAHLGEEEGLYWWQLTPEARQEQLRRMQQREQRQQQQRQRSSTVSARAAPDGEEVADEAALREWDALEASFGSSDHGGEDDDDGDERDSDQESGDLDEKDGDSHGSTGAETERDTSTTPSPSSVTRTASSSSSSSSDEEVEERRAWHSRLFARHHRRQSRRGTHRISRSSSSAAASSTSSGRTHTSPPSSRSSHQQQRRHTHGLGDGATSQRSSASKAQHSSRDAASSGHQERRSHHTGSGTALHEQASSNGSSRRTRRSLAKAATSSSSSRVSAHSERKLVRLLARRYEAVEEAMIITRSKSVLIHTLERQTHAHLPHLLAAAAQRQRRMMLATRVANVSGGGAHGDLARTSTPSAAAVEASGIGAGGGGGGGTPCAVEARGVDNLPVARPVLLIGSERSPMSSPPAMAGASSATATATAAASTPASTLPSSLSNAFPTSPGVALAVPASPLHQLPRISSTATLADGGAHYQSASHGFSTGQQAAVACDAAPESPEGETRTAALRSDGVAVGAADAGSPRGLTASRHSSSRLDGQDHASGSPATHEDTVDEVEDEEEPLAPVSWKFAFFMSRREARRSTITLQDLLEGMWLVCFRSTGRTHPMRFTRQMRVIVYPPLRTAEEEEEEGDHEREGEGPAAAAAAAAPSSGAGTNRIARTAAHAVHPPHAPLARGAGPVPAVPAAAAPPLPFHILQSGAQLVVHQFPPMKVQRRSVLSTQCQPAAGAGVVRAAAVVAGSTNSVPQRTPHAEREQRFLSEPQATLRSLRMRLMSPAASLASPHDTTAQTAAAAGSTDERGGQRSVVGEPEPRRGDAVGVAEVTQTSVRRAIAQQLGFAPAYVADVLGVPDGTTAGSAEDRRNFLSDGYEETATPHRAAGSAAEPRRRRERKGSVLFGPLTLEAFEAQQRLEACFAAGGAADVFNDWGWTITGQHVKIFSLDVTAPLYVERLQRIVDL